MAEENLPNKILDLFIVNSLHKLGDKFNIHGLVAGTIVSIYGIMIGLVAWLLFVPFSLVHSAVIIKLGIFSYLALLNHHILELIKSQEQDLAHKFMRALGTIVLIIVYLVIIDIAIGVGNFFMVVRATFGVPNTLLWSLPGLIAMILPLFLWEWLCKITPVDEIVKKAFK